MEARVLVTLSLPTPLYFCSGEDVIYWGVGPYLFLPRDIKAPKINIGDTGSMNWHIVLPDSDLALYDDITAIITDWDNIPVTFRKVTRDEGEAEFTELHNLIMTLTETDQDMHTRKIKLSMSGVVGLTKSSCLERPSRSTDPSAPPPNTIINIGNRQVRLGSGNRTRHEPPLGDAPRYQGPDWRRPTGRAIADPVGPEIPIEEAMGYGEQESGDQS